MCSKQDVLPVLRQGRVGAHHARHAAELRKEQLRIGLLWTAGGAPAGYEGVNVRHGASMQQREGGFKGFPYDVPKML